MANEDKKIGSRFVDAVEDLPGIKQIGAWNARNEEIKAILAERARSGESGIISQGLQGVIDVGGSIIGAPFQAIDKGVGIVSDVTNVDKRLVDAGITTAVTLAGVKGSKTGAYKAGAATRNVGKTLKQRVGNINQPASKQTISVNSSKAYQDLVRDYPTTTNSMGGFVPKAVIPSKEAALQTRISQFQSGVSKSTRDLNLTTTSAKTATGNLIGNPSPETVHTINDLTGRKALLADASKWLKANPGKSRGDYGIIMYKGKPQSLSGVSEHTAVSGSFEQLQANKKTRLTFRPPKTESRQTQLDTANIDIVNEELTRMNEAWDGTRGVDPEVLNPAIYRKVVNSGARLKDKITSSLSRQLGIKLDKEHAFGPGSLEGLGQDDPLAQHSGEKGFNIKLGQSIIANNAFSQEAGNILGMPTYGASKEELAKMHPRRRKVMEQFGYLQSMSERAMQSKDPGAFKAENKALKEQWKGIQEGDPNIVPTSPGRIVTDADLLKIQQLGQQGMDRTRAAEIVLAEREALNSLIQAGLEVGPKELEVLKKYLKHIEIQTKVQKAKEVGKPTKEYPYEDRPIEHYPKKTVLTSEATGKPVSKEKLLELQRYYNNDPSDL